MNICPKCNHENDDVSIHCTQCGSEIIHSCCSCGTRIRNDQNHCSVCGIGILQAEISTFSCSGVRIGGESGNGQCVLKLSDQRLFIITSVTGKERVYAVNLESIRKIDVKGSIIHANKGRYQLKILTKSPKKQFKLVADGGKAFAKQLKKAKKAKNKQGKKHHPVTNSAGNQIPTQSIVSEKTTIENKDPSKMSFLLGLLCFFVPFVGIAVWASDKSKYPKKARLAILLSIYPTLMIFILPIISSRANTSYPSNPSSTSYNSISDQVEAPVSLSQHDKVEQALEDFDISVFWYDSPGTDIVITFNVQENLTGDMTVDGAEYEIGEMLKKLFEANVSYRKIEIRGWLAMTNDFGETNNVQLFNVTYSKETIDRIVWDNFFYTSAFDIVDDESWFIPGISQHVNN